MFGQFNPQGPEGKESEEQLSLEEQAEQARKEQVDEFFDGYTQGRKTLSGKEYANLFQVGMNAGLTDKEFKTYIDEHGIRIDSGDPPDFPTGTVRSS